MASRSAPSCSALNLELWFLRSEPVEFVFRKSISLVATIVGMTVELSLDFSPRSWEIPGASHRSIEFSRVL